MRIGLNALFWRPDRMGGTQTYLFELLNAFLASDCDDEFVVFLGSDAVGHLPIRNRRLTVEACPVPSRRRGLQLLWEQVGFEAAVRRSRIAVLHSLGYLAPRVRIVPQVVTLLDLVHYAYPAEIEPLKRMLWSYLLRTSLRRASAVITISDSVRAELGSRFPWAAPKAIAVLLGVDLARFSPSVEPPRQPPFILAVGSPSRHKNLDGLLLAFALVRSVRPDVTLRLAGMRTPTTGRLKMLAEQSGIGDAVAFLGRVSDDRLVELYRTATVMAFPSLYEGFGLPPLEAMASGCPVVCVDCAAVREVVGDAALVTDAADPRHLADALLQVLDGTSDVAGRLRQRGLARASLFPWAQTARRTRAVYQSLVHDP